MLDEAISLHFVGVESLHQRADVPFGAGAF
jgi:hypothetical protein